MPDVREVFQMSTQKVRPDRGFMDRQDQRQRRRTRNRKVGAYVVVAAMIAIVAGFAVVSQRDGADGVPADSGTPSQSATEAVSVVTSFYLDIATGDRTPVAANLTAARLMEVSPDGTRVAYNTCCDDDAVYVANLDGSGKTQVTPDELDGYTPTWIDDGRLLIQARPQHTIQLGDLYVVDVRTLEMTMVADLPDEGNGSWVIVSDVSPDGTTLLYHLPRGKGSNAEWDLWTAPLAGGAPTLLRRDAGFAQYASDGSIVFLDHPYDFQADSIWLMDGDGTNARNLDHGDRLDGTSPYTWPRVSPDGARVAFGDEAGRAIVFDLFTGEVTETGQFSEEPAWYGNDTLIVD
jgi:hypothetical protein